MRKIDGTSQGHNAAHRLAVLTLVVAAGAALSGCGSDKPAAQRYETGAPTVASRCALVVSDAGLREFYDLADLVAAGQRPDLAAMTAAADTPTWQFWRRSYLQEIVRPEPVGRAMHIAMLGRDELPDRQRDKTVRLDLVRNFELAIERRAEITAAVERFVADERGCQVKDRLRGFLPQSDLPDTLRLAFMVALPEIRFFEDVLLVDAGLLWASGQDQLVRFLASTVYKQRTLVDGRSPSQATGPAILLHCLRLVRNEGVAAYLDAMDEISFEPRHPILGRSSPKPDELCLAATRTLRSLDTNLTDARRREHTPDEQWMDFFRLFVAAGSWQSTGWFMAEVIVDRLGLERLQTDGRSVPAFFAAYHEAAAIAKPAPQAPPGSVARFVADPPAFSPENAAWLDHELRQLFP